MHIIYNRIDIVVNNAGYGQMGAIEEVSLEQAKRNFQVNVWGTYSVMQAVLPYLRKQGSGHILNLSSVGGIRSVRGGGVYCATKHAIEAFK
jgi:NADP-dependent 3-hydroxy acid dehydrogenase YdfG